MDEIFGKGKASRNSTVDHHAALITNLTSTRSRPTAINPCAASH
ncbi:hypothetical protein [Streptomyces sp. NBC_00120]|uniref:Uncharacterized protein n=1 Tax=Streptomyces sp. NBC_00119 TaxID=2975659 RepID=A0AAU1U1D4_9ACTN|nr:hypothetical protein [Streptomyces sp. NBC_00120]MCX5321794.1 hypothetical protein [Streptomyces sp. NBC_00120]